jgi:hypothetical protein
MRVAVLTKARPALPGRALALTLLLALLAGCSELAGCSVLAGRSAGAHTAGRSAAAKAVHHYGGYASYLPRDTLHPDDDGTLTGTIKRPALASEGEAVRVETAHWSVLMTVSGPVVPGEGLPFQASATTCTWTVTMSGATSPVPIAAADFTTIDHLGTVYRPHLVPGQRKPPQVLRPGQKVTFELRAVEVVGEGLMRWAPDEHHAIGASWDFEVEND